MPQRRKTIQKKRAPFDWTFPQPDWQDRIRRGQMPIDLTKMRPHLNLDRSDRVRRILNNFRLPDVPGQPRLEQAMGEWFFAAVLIAA